MSKNIRLSPKHGVNPAIPRCFYCGKDKNEILLVGLMRDDQEAPRNMVWDKRPCDECAGWMRQGVMLISVKDGESGENPYRTGCTVVVKEEVIAKIFKDPTEVLKQRCAFVEDTIWDRLGLPREAGAPVPPPTAEC